MEESLETIKGEDRVISVRDLVYYYPSYEDEEINTVIDGLNLDIGRGEFVAILGHNGSGKSTLAKLLNAQMLPREGSIEILGYDTRDQDKIWDIRSNCGIVFQNPDNQMVASIVEEEVAFGPENLGIPNPELRNRVDKALKSVGMYEYKRRQPQHLSGGQKQRIAIAGVLAMEPECLIMDEPTAMLDPIGRQEIMDTIQYLNREEGKTIVLITHFMEEAVLADRVIVMSRGKIAVEGKAKQVFSQVDKMKDLELGVPQVTQLAHRLNKDGFNIPNDVLTIEEFVEAIL